MSVIPAQAAVQTFKAEGLYGVIPAQAGIQRVTAAQAAVQRVIPAKAAVQTFEAEGFDGVTARESGNPEVIGKNWIPAYAGMTQKRNTGLLLAQE